MTTPIDPCPFCGDKGPEVASDELEIDSEEFFVTCGNCQAEGPRARVGCRDADDVPIDLEEEAIALWNRREQPDTEEE